MTFLRAALLILATVPGCKGNTGLHKHDPVKGPAELPHVSSTVYQNGLEVFVEYPALVVGRASPLVAHFTDARDPDGFKAIARGRVTAVLRYPNGTDERFAADTPLREGVFKPIATPKTAGQATLTLALDGEQLAGAVDIGTVKIHATVEAAAASQPEHPRDAEQTIAFRKEQQWKTRFATAPATLRVLQGAVRANGEIKAVAGQSAELSAPAAARIPISGRVPHLGQVVRKGEILLNLSPTNVASGTTLAAVDLEVSRGRAELGLAERDLKRAQDLFAGKAIPEKHLDAARTAHQIAAARLEAAERQRTLYRSTQTGAIRGGGPSAFELRSPIDGVIAFADIKPGAVAEAGVPLIAVVNTKRLWLEARVYDTDAPRIEGSAGATFTIAGFDREFVIGSGNGRRIAIGAVVDRATRTVPVIFEFDNPDGLVKPGMFAKVKLLTGETIRGVAIPESAVVDDNGRPVAFVMSTAETFRKRPLRLGVRSGGYVEVLGGVKEGERVVTRGAYEIKLSSASGAIPEHGHQH